MQLVLDWDGTVTERDTLDLVLSAFGDREIYERAEVELDAGRMTLNDRRSLINGLRALLAAADVKELKDDNAEL